MNANIRKLHRIASKKSRLIIGLMSGTSLDGLDVALCKITGHGSATKVQLVQFDTWPYEPVVKDRIRKVFAKQQIAFHDLVELNPWIGNLHAEIVLKCLRKWKISPAKVDLIASHGQTVFHAPKAVTTGANLNATLQIGDGDHLAVKSGIVTMSDFRQKHIAAGGEGAPLAMYGDYLLFHKKGETRVLLNIGGIGNFTFLPSHGRAAGVLVTDTGPGNTLLDQWVQKNKPGIDYDADGRFASQGAVHGSLLAVLKQHPYFQLPLPKTTGPEQFNLTFVREAQEKSRTTDLRWEDVLATLTRFSAETMAEAIGTLKLKSRFHLYVSGGGAHNPLLQRWLQELLPMADLHRMDALGFSGDAKEAILFAVLANESLAGGRVNFGQTAKVPSVSMGKISFPQ